ncbi:MAG: hypothetical protein E6J79_01045, partial [Deltaproteobacteria bacterium]
RLHGPGRRNRARGHRRDLHRGCHPGIPGRTGHLHVDDQERQPERHAVLLARDRPGARAPARARIGHHIHHDARHRDDDQHDDEHEFTGSHELDDHPAEHHHHHDQLDDHEQAADDEHDVDDPPPGHHDNPRGLRSRSVRLRRR